MHLVLFATIKIWFSIPVLRMIFNKRHRSRYCTKYSMKTIFFSITLRLFRKSICYKIFSIFCMFLGIKLYFFQRFHISLYNLSVKVFFFILFLLLMHCNKQLRSNMVYSRAELQTVLSYILDQLQDKYFQRLLCLTGQIYWCIILHFNIHIFCSFWMRTVKENHLNLVQIFENSEKYVGSI